MSSCRATNANSGRKLPNLRKALPSTTEVTTALNPTQVGKELGIGAAAVNLHLVALGLQFADERGDWQLTEAGKDHGTAHPYERNGHTGHQVRWNRSVIEVIRGRLHA